MANGSEHRITKGDTTYHSPGDTPMSTFGLSGFVWLSDGTNGYLGAVAWGQSIRTIYCKGFADPPGFTISAGKITFPSSGYYYGGYLVY